MAKNRKAECSVMSVILCLMVIFIHVSSDPIVRLMTFSWQHIAVFIPWQLSSVAVFGFLFLSGLKLFLPGVSSFSAGKFYRRRFFKIVIPYILWVVIYELWYVHPDYYPFDWGEFFLSLISGDVASHLYFIVILIQFYALMPLWVKIVPKVRPLPLILGSVVLSVFFFLKMPWILSLFGIEDFVYNDRLFTTYLCFWIAGCCAGLYYEKFKAFLRRWKMPLFIVFFLAAAGDAVFYYFITIKAFYFYGCGLLHFVYCFAAISFLFLISLGLSSRKAVSSPWFSRLDRASFAIYLSHYLILNIVDIRIAAQGIWAIDVAYALRFLLTYILSVGGCMLYIFLKEKAGDLLLAKTKK